MVTPLGDCPEAVNVRKKIKNDEKASVVSEGQMVERISLAREKGTSFTILSYKL